MEHNFKIHGTDAKTDARVPYDYCSIMHYGAKSFSKVMIKHNSEIH